MTMGYLIVVHKNGNYTFNEIAENQFLHQIIKQNKSDLNNRVIPLMMFPCRRPCTPLCKLVN